MSIVVNTARTLHAVKLYYDSKMNFSDVFPQRQRRRFRFRRIRSWSIVRWIVGLGVAGLVLGFIAIASAFAWYSRDLPSPDRIVRREGFSTKILSRDGELLYDVYGDVQREPVNLADVPDTLKLATIAVEDKNFYKHEGFDPLGMGRAVWNIVVHRRLQGGSTLTQQLVKKVLLTSERNIPRKIKEFVLSVQIEQKFTKDQILQMYLQEAPYGGQAVGVEVASRTYFGKPLRDLALVESAILAGMPQAPSRYSPYGVNPEAYVGRTTQVLRRMREDGYLSRDEEQDAVETLPSVSFRPQGGSIRAPHFVMYVRDLLVKQFGEDVVENGGLKVTTTLDLPLQEKAEEVVSSEIEKVKNLAITNGATLVMNPTTGEILAMVGSRDFFSEDIDGQVNVTLRPRQPGSAIKPVTYASAFRKGFTPSTMMVDTKTSFDSGDPLKPYEPENYDGKFRGPVQLRFALGSSLNVPSVQLLQLVGLRDMLTLAHEMGLSTLAPTVENMRRLGLSVTLGGGEVRLIDLVSAYSAFANGGERVEPIAMLRVENPQGKTMFEYRHTKGRTILTQQEAFLVNHILSDNSARLLTFGVNSLLNMGARPVAVKTGTTNDRKDNWAIGWSRSVVVGAWVGNNDNSSMKQVASGVSGASPIWRTIMLEALTKYPAKSFDIPPGVVATEVDVVSGYIAHDGWSSRAEYFIDGTLPDGPDPIHTKVAVCRADGKLATDVDIAKGDAEEKEFIILRAPDSLSSPDRDRWQKAYDEWVATQSDPRYLPPTETCGVNAEDIVVRLKQPSDQSRVNSNDVDWEAEVVSTKKTEQVELFVNGLSKQILTSAPWRSTVSLPNGAYTLRVKAKVEGGREKESSDVKIGVNQDWNAPPAGGPTPTSGLSPSPTP